MPPTAILAPGRLALAAAAPLHDPVSRCTSAGAIAGDLLVAALTPRRAKRLGAPPGVGAASRTTMRPAIPAVDAL
ncbi:MAG: hypothetical protein ACYDEB_08145 [Dehalococcoidia bacterium]